MLLAIGLHILLGGAVPEFRDLAQWYLIIPVFIYVPFFSVLGEEIGWRGHALPELQANHSALTASLIIGVWGLWHVPLWWIKGNFHQDIPDPVHASDHRFFNHFTWIYNNMRGSLLIVHLFYAASNITLGMLPILPVDTGDDLHTLWLAVGLLWTFAIAIVTIFGPAHLSLKAVH